MSKPILDISYCSGLRCDRKDSCYRWLGNWKAEDFGDRCISIAQFADHDGKCGMWIEKDRDGETP